MKKNNLRELNIWFFLFISSILIYIFIGFFLGDNNFCLAIKDNLNNKCLLNLSFLDYIVKYSWFWLIPIFLFNQWRQENIIDIIRNSDKLKIRIQEILNSHSGENKINISLIESLLDEDENNEFEINKFLGSEKVSEFRNGTAALKKEILEDLKIVKSRRNTNVFDGEIGNTEKEEKLIGSIED